MCLELVSNDLGSAVANAIAKRLVLYARRPGYQSQFSPLLSAQTKADAPFAKLIQWMGEHLSENLDVPRLAARVAMSERSFHRKFTAATGETPAHFVETLRLDHARSLLSARIALKEIAAKTGYATPPNYPRPLNGASACRHCCFVKCIAAAQNVSLPIR